VTLLFSVVRRSARLRAVLIAPAFSSVLASLICFLLAHRLPQTRTQDYKLKQEIFS
jgi:hypothetical protein